MSMSRSLGSLVVRIAAEGLGGYKADLDRAASDTTAAAQKMERSADQASSAAGRLVTTLERQVATFGASASAVRRYDAERINATASERAAIDAHLDSLDALEQQRAKQDSLTASARNFGMVIGTLAVATTALGIATVKSNIDAADAMNDLSQRVGVTVKDLAKYELASKQSGTTMESLSGGIKSLSGNLLEHGAALRKAGITATNADDAMKQLANVFSAMPDSIEKTNLAVHLFGKSGMDLIPMLNMGADGLAKASEKSAKYAATMAEMAPLADAYNDNMAELAMHNKVATMSMTQDLLPALISITAAMGDAAKTGGFFKGVMAGIDEFGNQAFDWSGNAQRKTIRNLENDIADLREQQKRLTLDIFGQGGVIQADIDTKIALLAKTKAAYYKLTEGSAGGGRGMVNPPSVKPAGDTLADYRALMEALKDGKGKAALSDYQKITQELTKHKTLAEEELKFGGDLAASVKFEISMREKLTDLYANDKISMVEFEAAYDSVLDIAGKLNTLEEAKAAQKNASARAAALNKERDEIEKYMAAESARYQVEAQGSEEAVKQAQLQFESMGLLKSQVAELTLARLQDRTVNLTVGTEAYESLQRQIVAQQDLIGVLRNTEAKEEAISMWKSIDSTAHDVFVNIFEGGQSAFKKLGNVLKSSLLDLLYQATVKKWIVNIGASMSGGGSYGDMLAGATGNGTGASMLGGMLSSGGSMLGNAASTVGGWLGWGGATAAGTGIAASVGTGTALAATGSGLGLSAGAAGTGYGFAAGGGLGMTAGSAGASTIGAGLGTSAAAGGSGAAAAGGSSVLAAIPVWGWVALAAIAIASQAKGETRSGGQYSYDANSGVAALLQGPSGGEIQGDVVKQSIAGTAGGINGLLKGMGSTAVLTGFQAGLESSDRGRGGVFSGGTLSTGATFGESGKGSNYEGTLYEQTSSHSVDSKEAFANFTADMFQTTIQAVQAAVKSGAGVPDTIAKMVDGVDAESMTSEAAQALVANMQATVSGVTALRDAMQTMGLKELSFDAAAGLIAAAGGMDKLGASLGTYYDRFYSADEKTGVMTKNISAEFAKLGITMPAVTDQTRAWYRSEVERLMALDQAVPANAKATADILSLASAVDQIAPSMDTATGSVQGFTDTVMGLVDGIHNSVAGSIFDMQYGLKDDAGKYGMLDQQAKGFDDAMRGATDINQIAEFAQKEIDTINKAFALLDPQQQADKLGEMTALLTKVDEFVTQSGADAISLKKAENADLADAVAGAVEKAMETLASRMADTAIALASSTAKMGEAVSRPAEVKLFVSAPAGSEVRVS